MSLKTLEDDIKEKKLHQMYLLYGDESYEIEKYLDKIKKVFGTIELGVNYFVLDKSNIDTLQDICDGVTFFGEEKLVVVKKTGLKFNTSVLESITNDKLVIIFIEDDVDKRTSEYKLLLKKSVAIEFTKINEKDAAEYIMRTLKAYKIQVSLEVAQAMVQMCGTDKQILINEFKKIVAYLGEGKTLTEEIVGRICVKTLNAKIFDVVEQIVNKKKDIAIENLDDLLAQKTYIGIITSLIFKQIKQLYYIKLLEGTERSNGVKTGILEVLKISPYIYSKLKVASDIYSIEELEKILEDFREYDVSSKTGKIDVVLGLKRIILSM